ncbi:baseplate J/gp47 family protein [Rhizobium sp. CFBP 8762]|uniref:baseplate J/gp47 family protein n=1 Tax=Rhizobium sp. CFBP 8762 TaxID=2775279 RepID=UPI001785BF75|nr:baseplate J/gp47 family protein [Rhizobium sp. CFBP 8762]MBD8556907.1 baseplate J/gp47 family protein [Rhizobium sp. CFBP 8762]
MAFVSDTLDLSRLGAAELVGVNFEATLAARLILLQQFWNAAREKNPDLPAFNVAMLESDPAIILNEEFAYSETLILQMINDAAKGLRLAQATGANLDHLATTYHRTQRRVIVAATERTAAQMETDEALRSRAQLAPEALADMGLTPGGYVYRIRTAFAQEIKHAWPIHRGAGRVEVRLLGRSGDGMIGPDLIAEIVAAFSAEDGQQSTDVVTFLPAEIDAQDWTVTLVVPKGPDLSVVRAQAERGLWALADSLHRIHAAVFREAISAAAHVGPVITVRVNAPVTDRPARPETVPHVRSITVETEVV